MGIGGFFCLFACFVILRERENGVETRSVVLLFSIFTFSSKEDYTSVPLAKWLIVPVTNHSFIDFGLHHVTCFGQWNVSRYQTNRDLKHAFMVWLILLSFCQYHEKTYFRQLPDPEWGHIEWSEPNCSLTRSSPSCPGSAWFRNLYIYWLFSFLFFTSHRNFGSFVELFQQSSDLYMRVWSCVW